MSGLLSPFGLIRANAVVTIQTVAVTQVDGGTVETFSTLKAGVPVLITQFGGDRDKPYGTDAATDRGTLTGTDADLNRTAVRLLVTTPPPGRPEMAGWFLRIDGPVGHPRSQFGLIAARVTLRWSRVDIPAT